MTGECREWQLRYKQRPLPFHCAAAQTLASLFFQQTKERTECLLFFFFKGDASPACMTNIAIRAVHSVHLSRLGFRFGACTRRNTQLAHLSLEPLEMGGEGEAFAVGGKLGKTMSP